MNFSAAKVWFLSRQNGKKKVNKDSCSYLHQN